MDLYNIWLSMVLGSNIRDGCEIMKLYTTAKLLYENRKSWHDYGVFTSKQMERAMAVSIEEAQQVQQIHNSCGIMSVSCFEGEYPDCFRVLPDPPIVLFYKGNLLLLDEPYRIGIVGSRHPDRDGVMICDNICTTLAQQGIVTVSGLAQGLDSIAHRATLAAGGKTIAFIGTGLDRYYPASHRELQDEICRKGCVLSEYHAGQTTFSSSFLERNRLIAAASHGVCVMQAQLKSGSLTTAKKAQEYCKKLFAVPGNITNPLYDGSNRLIQDGAYPLLSAQDVLISLGLAKRDEKPVRKPKPKLTAIEQKIYDCIGRESKSTNQIFTRTKIPMVQLKALLTKMEMDGVITSQSAGVYCIK